MTSQRLNEALRMIDAGNEAGVQIVREIASAGDPDGLFALADLFWSGTLVPQNPVQGRLLFEYAASYGHPEGNLLATNLLGSGVAGTRNWPAALERLEAEARVIPERRIAADLVAAMNIDAEGNPAAIPAGRTLSEHPRASMFEGLLTAAECDYLIKTADRLFEPSMVYNEAHELVRDTIRTSDGGAFHWAIEDPAIHAINRRIAAATGTAYEQGEALQILRYIPGQEYRPHFDFVNGATNQRLWTALVYLNDHYQGGETRFVRTGLEVRGRTGDMLLFWNIQGDGHGDPLAEHAGLPVTSGTKYLATRWIREGRWIP
jgi:prolyl 4-hydroxylase